MQCGANLLNFMRDPFMGPDTALHPQMPSNEKLRELVRTGTIGNSFVPVLCGSAFKNKARACYACSCAAEFLDDASTIAAAACAVAVHAWAFPIIDHGAPVC